MSATYRVIMRGIRPGQARDHVARRLAELFKMDVEQVTSMLSAGAMTIKRGVDLKTAAKYQASLEKRGCACLIEPEQGARQPAPVVTVTSTAPVQPFTRTARAIALGAAMIGVGLLAAFVLRYLSVF